MPSNTLVPVVQSYGDAPPPATTTDNYDALLVLALIVGFLALTRGGGTARWDDEE